MKVKKAILFSLCLVLWLVGIREGFCAPLSDAPLQQVWWFNVPGLSLQDLRTPGQPHLEWMMEHASVGAMNMKTGGRETLSNSYAALGAGTRAVAPADEGFYHPDEPVVDVGGLESTTAGLLYTRRMGEEAPRGSVVYPGIMRYRAENEKIHFTVKPGALGEALQQKGLSTLVLGNLDEGNKPVRYAPLLTMNSRGITPEGSVGKGMLVSDPKRPYGVKTHYRRIGDRLFSWRKSGLAVVDLGDLYRLEKFGETMSPTVRQKMRQQILMELDAFLGQVLSRAGENRLVMLTSTSGGLPEEEGLFPVLMYQSSEKQPGLLTSSTTRRTGMISNIDLAPTLLDRMGVEIPDEMMGRPMKVVTGNNGMFWSTVDRVESINRLRPSVLYSYILIQMLVLVTGLTLILKNGRGRGWMESVFLAVMLTPFLFLILSDVTAGSWWMVSGTLVLTGLAFSKVLTRASTLPLLFWAGLLGFLPVVVDGLLGGPLIRHSFLGYDPIKGARYYGVGNEYMGVVLGSSILACAAWLERRPSFSRRVRLGVGLFFFALLVFFAAPFWGTNAGGALASAVGFGVAYLRFFKAKWSRRATLKMMGMAAIGILTLVALNVWFPVESPSHIGKALSDLQGGNFEEIVQVINRKLEMNLKLIRFSSWGKVFLLSLLAMAVLAFRPAGGLKMLTQRYPQLFNGFTAILAGSLAALAFNDSGIVSAATAIVYVVMPVMIIGIREWTGGRDRVGSAAHPEKGGP
ncbi:hypothetical protein [Kroppenstedtia guangzhouensis]|uniref:hypothetical protein n=1 Tax=Kroppenstedtia guangzhouensis TaxID=1274356 RepID=UPI001666D52F|nr:hypothetical protein [Kroppenstedtia guangzhouensis]